MGITKPRRTVDQYYKYMMKDEPNKKLRRKLSNRCRSGGIEFEDETKKFMGDKMEIKWGPIIDQKSGKTIHWTYVGDFWWARKVRNKYQFGRLYAVENLKNSTDRNYVGLWDERRYAYKKDPIIVRSILGRKGTITSWNKFEMFVHYDDDFGKPSIPVKYGDVEFHYKDDERRFKKLFGVK